MNKKKKILTYILLMGIVFSSLNLNKVAMALPTTDKVELYLKIVSHQNATYDVDHRGVM